VSLVTPFAQQRPVIALPAGVVQSFDSERVFSIAGNIVAVGISARLFLVNKPPQHSEYPWPLLEQLVGYIAAGGATVLRMDIHFPLSSHQTGKFETTALIWANRFLLKSCKRRLSILLPPVLPPYILVPWAGTSECALAVWQEVLQLADAFVASFPDETRLFIGGLWSLAQTWETAWDQALQVAENHQVLTDKDRPGIYEVDRAWATVVREYLEPIGYRMSAKSMARLL